MSNKGHAGHAGCDVIFQRDAKNPTEAAEAICNQELSDRNCAYSFHCLETSQVEKLVIGSGVYRGHSIDLKAYDSTREKKIPKSVSSRMLDIPENWEWF